MEQSRRVEPDGRDTGRSSSPADEVEAAYRGFLFSDLRGYTAFVEGHGNQAGAELLDAYRELIRTEVAHHRGAEIRTEGDSFYVVFPSAQRAVTCALAIVAAAALYNGAHPWTTISIGVGVHAGETIERPDGYIGSAVNVAARVCAQARSGEVLVTATVRELTRSGIPVAFSPRGSHRLKGIKDPVALFAAHPAGAAGVRIHSSRALVIVPAAVVGAVLIGWVALQFARPGAGPGAGFTAATDGGLSLASASPTETVVATTAEFPTGAEARLLARLDDSVARHCQRADPADVPTLDEAYSIVTPLAHDAGLECRLGSTSEPDIVWYWSSVSGQRHDQVGAIFAQTAGRRSIPPGDCAAEDLAFGRWEFGGTEGDLLCYGSRNANVVWTYDDENLFATAFRSDGDMRALFNWWRDHARLLGS